MYILYTLGMAYDEQLAAFHSGMTARTIARRLIHSVHHVPPRTSETPALLSSHQSAGWNGLQNRAGSRAWRCCTRSDVSRPVSRRGTVVRRARRSQLAVEGSTTFAECGRGWLGAVDHGWLVANAVRAMEKDVWRSGYPNSRA